MKASFLQRPRPARPATPARVARPRPNRAPRRGVLMLVVMSLLMLMAVMCVTFILVSSQTRRIIREEVRAEQKAEDYRKELDGALLQLLRGVKPTNRASAIGDNDLLGDMYGNDAVSHRISSLEQVFDTNSQPVSELADIVVTTPTTATDLPGIVPGFFNGRVLTMTTGRMRGQSTRIVGSNSTVASGPGVPQRTVWRLRVATFPGQSGWPNTSDAFLINGLPFNGTGFGYSIAGNPHWGPNVKLRDFNGIPLPPLPVALAPFANIAGVPRDQGGADEDYDAPDPQNMHLAYIEYAAGKPAVILPSFHRPDLIKYARIQAGNPASAKAWVLADIQGSGATPPRVPTLKLVNARPLPVDHPKFTGGNPAFGASLDKLCQWQFGGSDVSFYDVDNDGDGIPESIWVDLGFPVQSTPDGRKFKPLFAIYCTDLDGRLNVNAHGNILQATRSEPPYPPYTTTPPPKEDIRDWLPASAQFKTAYPAAGVYPANQPPFLGSGYGVAEINLLAMFQHPILGGSLSNGQLMYQRFFRGISPVNSLSSTDPPMGQLAFEGRYGELAVSTLDADVKTIPVPGRSNNWSAAGPVNRGDYWSFWIKHAEIPDAYYPAPTASYTHPSYKQQLTSLSPSDMWGRGMTFVDVGGNPVFLPLPEQWHFNAANVAGDRFLSRISERKSNPYVLDLSRSAVRDSHGASMSAAGASTGPFDNPFTPAELETLLRPFDADAPMLAKRLRMLLLQSTTPSPDAVDLVRRLVTTDSFDVAATPTVAIPKLENLLTDQFATAPDYSGAKPFPYDRVTNRQTANEHFSLSMADLVAAKVRRAKPGITAQDLKTIVQDLLPPEVIAGQKFDLSRPFGNGQDDNGNWTVDEPGELEVARAEMRDALGTSLPALTGGVDVYKDGTIDAKDNAGVRYLFAKYLYVMAMALADEEYTKLTADPKVPDKKAFLARRLAQWAVNVVDYRDPDAIMTDFEYDPNPFDGWEVDGRLDTVEAPPGTGKRELVWGCEAPDLALSETMAFHDLRVNDTAKDSIKKNMSDGDTDPDQIRVPEGSLFVELYCPRSANGTAALPPELYKDGQLELEKWAGNAPVWRMVISEKSQPDLNEVLKQNPDAITPQPFPAPLQPTTVVPNLRAVPGGQAMNFERVVWFTRRQPTGQDRNVTFYNHNSKYNSNLESLLSPGQYALVGPRRLTNLGSRKPQPATDFPELSNRLIRIPLPKNPTDADEQVPLSQLKSDKTHERYKNLHPSRGAAFARMQPTVGIVCASDPVGSFTGNEAWQSSGTPQQDIGVGLNVSEPLFSRQYYNVPRYASKSGLKDAYGKYDNTAPFPTRPEDLRLGTSSPIAAEVSLMLTSPPSISGKETLNHRIVFLQRLANPLQPFDADLNPYITVDFMPIDITVFNGEWLLDSLPKPDLLARQRGNQPAGADINFLSSATSKSLNETFPPGPALKDSGDSYFSGTFNHSFGFLNLAFGETWPKAAAADPLQAMLVGYPNFVMDPSSALPPSPWFNWADRALVSAYELLMVPACSAPRRAAEAYLDQLTYKGPALLKPGEVPLNGGAEYDGETAYQQPFRQYLNFFAAGKARSASGGEPAAPNFYRLLDFVHVPSRFVGTDKYLNPSALAKGLKDEQAMVSYLRPPFNKISEYREPGKVNINTIASPVVWQAVVNGSDLTDTKNWMPNWGEMRDSRVGKTGIPGVTNANAGGSALFANPFRSGAGGAYGLPGAIDSNTFLGVNASLLRQHADKHPLFAPLLTGAVTPPLQNYNDYKRHPYFFFQNLQKISNLVTTRSNVYAVWITVGYFEVAPVSDVKNLPVEYQKLIKDGKMPDAILSTIYPDGYVLGQELNADTGEIARHRAFYILDRTIPVAYERGEDHNVDNTILLRRLIE